jgi:hypothetical protein
MLVHAILTPAESKMPIVKAVVGMVVFPPCSSKYYIMEELIGAKPETNFRDIGGSSSSWQLY